LHLTSSGAYGVFAMPAFPQFPLIIG
jgi:hypothetical protein